MADAKRDMTAETNLPQRRVVLLGASNLTRGIGAVVSTACRTWDQPLEILIAAGHGRCYATRSWVLGRTLSEIFSCGLWSAMSQRPTLPTAALVTDVGNDLLGENSVSQIASRIEHCLDLLASASARTVITRLPLENLRTLSERRYLFFRTLLFPVCRHSLALVRDRALELDAWLCRTATDRGIPLITPRSEWYGFDPIHIKNSQIPRAWSEILASWSDAAAPPAPSRRTLGREVYLRTLLPERRWLLGIEQRRQQPAGRLSDGTTISLF
jgi:hypothetical protein